MLLKRCHMTFLAQLADVASQHSRRRPDYAIFSQGSDAEIRREPPDRLRFKRFQTAPVPGAKKQALTPGTAEPAQSNITGRG
jgi:hypothetical protein